MPKQEEIKLHPFGHKLKLCRGPSHKKPVWLHYDRDFYKRGHPKYRDRARACCKKCEALIRVLNSRVNDPNARINTHVLTRDYLWIFKELFLRVGFQPICDELEISIASFYHIRNLFYNRISKELAGKAVKMLFRVRREQQCTPEEAFKRRKQVQVSKWRKKRKAA